MYSYLPHTEGEIAEMLEAIGVKSVDDLFSDIPDNVKLNRELNLAKGISEYEVMKKMQDLANRNKTGVSFLGCGSYDHIIPAVVHHIAGLPNFFTAYTPYQAEISQGVLTAIFEFQSLICELTGLDASNASLYDGHTAAIEAVAMAVNSKKKADTILYSETIHPHTLQVLKTYYADLDIKLAPIAAKDGVTSFEDMKSKLDGTVAAVLVQTPNFMGAVEDYTGFAEAIHENKSFLIISSNPMALGSIKSQAEWGADIAIGDTQPFGLPSYFGGPGVGYLSAKSNLVRKMAGRIVGQTEDHDGKRAFVLTLQAREQHIKRERATSNICSNQALAALCSTIYMCSVGWKGVQEASRQSMNKAHYLYDRLTKELGFKAVSQAPFFNEFTLEVPGDADKVLEALKGEGIFGGIRQSQFDSSRSNQITIAVTEKRTKEEMDQYVEIVKRVL